MIADRIDELQLQTGCDLSFPELGITVHQPVVLKIAEKMTEQDYFIALQVFRMNKESLNITSPEATDWDVLNQSLSQQIDGIPDLKDLVTRFLRLFVEKINFGPRSLMVMTEKGVVNIEPEQLTELQAIVGRVGGAYLLKPTEEEFRPLNRQAAAIAEKMKKARARLRAQ